MTQKELEARRLKVRPSEGRTPVLDLVQRHRDVVELDFEHLGQVAEAISSAVGAERSHRATRAEVIRILRVAVEDGRLDLGKLNEAVREAIESKGRA